MNYFGYFSDTNVLKAIYALIMSKHYQLKTMKQYINTSTTTEDEILYRTYEMHVCV